MRVWHYTRLDPIRANFKDGEITQPTATNEAVRGANTIPLIVGANDSTRENPDAVERDE